MLSLERFMDLSFMLEISEGSYYLLICFLAAFEVSSVRIIMLVCSRQLFKFSPRPTVKILTPSQSIMPPKDINNNAVLLTNRQLHFNILNSTIMPFIAVWLCVSLVQNIFKAHTL